MSEEDFPEDLPENPEQQAGGENQGFAQQIAGLQQQQQQQQQQNIMQGNALHQNEQSNFLVVENIQ